MRTTKVKDVACIGPCDHDEKLKAGDDHHVMFRENDLGPFQLTAEKKLESECDQGNYFKHNEHAKKNMISILT